MLTVKFCEAEQETFQQVWEVVSFVMAVLSLVGLLVAPVFLTKLAIRILAAK